MTLETLANAVQDAPMVFGFAPEQIPSLIVTLLLAIISSGAFGSWVQGRQARKNQVPGNALENRKADTEGYASLSESQQKRIGQQGERIEELEDERTDMFRKYNNAMTHISVLEDDIRREVGPPPRQRPEGL